VRRQRASRDSCREGDGAHVRGVVGVHKLLAHLFEQHDDDLGLDVVDTQEQLHQAVRQDARPSMLVGNGRHGRVQRVRVSHERPKARQEARPDVAGELAGEGAAHARRIFPCAARGSAPARLGVSVADALPAFTPGGDDGGPGWSATPPWSAGRTTPASCTTCTNGRAAALDTGHGATASPRESGHWFSEGASPPVHCHLAYGLTDAAEWHRWPVRGRPSGPGPT